VQPAGVHDFVHGGPPGLPHHQPRGAGMALGPKCQAEKEAASFRGGQPAHGPGCAQQLQSSQDWCRAILTPRPLALLLLHRWWARTSVTLSTRPNPSLRVSLACTGSNTRFDCCPKRSPLDTAGGTLRLLPGCLAICSRLIAAVAAPRSRQAPSTCSTAQTRRPACASGLTTCGRWVPGSKERYDGRQLGGWKQAGS